MILNLEEIIKKYNIEINGVIHIGAHRGQEHDTYKKIGIKNLMYFEPLKENFNILKSKIDDGSKLFNMALGNQNKKIKMFVETANQGMSSSILKPKEHLIQYPNIVFDNEEYVDMTRLDDVDFDRENYNMLNIDVQGYELEVLKGASNTLNKIDFILSEINKVHLYENGALLDEMNNFLSDFNFELVESDWAGVTWGDGFYINKRILNK